MHRKAASIVFLFVFIFQLKPQGIFTEFGQNRIQFQQFEWKTIAHENMEILFYGKEEILAAHVLKLAKQQLAKLEGYLAYKYGGTMQIVVFSNLNDYRQSNIGYTNPQMNSGGYLWIPNDVNTVYFNGDYHYLETQLTKSICEVIMREMIYGGSLQDRFERVRSAALPHWFTTGLSQFLAESWSAETEDRYRDAMGTHKFANFNLLTNEESTLAGVGIWRYLVEVYGPEAISTIVFIARYTHNVESAIYFHTKKTMVEFLADWRAYYTRELALDINQYLPKGKANIPAHIEGKTQTDFALSPDGNSVVIVTNDKGRFQIWEYNLQTKKVHYLYGGGRKVPNQIPDYHFPKIKWNPASNSIYALSYERSEYKLIQLQNGKNKTLNIDFSQFTGIHDFSFNSEGSQIVFSAVSEGQSDVWKYDLLEKKMQRLTNDFYHESHVIFGTDNSLIFVSNRPLEQDSNLRITRDVFNLFQVNAMGIKPLTGFGVKVNLHDPIVYSNKVIGFLCDISGLENAWVLHTDSGLRVFAQTNYKRSILAQQISTRGNATAEMLRINGQYIIFTGEIPANPIAESVTINTLVWKSKIENLDSLFERRGINNAMGMHSMDSFQKITVDSAQKKYTFQSGFLKQDFGDIDALDTSQNSAVYKSTPFINSLQPEFLLSQSDNRLLGSYMQSNKIEPSVLRNPVLMPFFKVSLSDVLKNYIIETGVRSSLDLFTTDFVSRFAILKYRFDHDVSISRHSRKYDEPGNKIKQSLSVQTAYTLSYPFNENSRLSISTGGRRELLAVKGSEKSTLNLPDKNDYYATGKIEFVYDNTQAQGLNRMTGLRVKTGLESTQKLKSNVPAIHNLFLDLRYYVPIGKAIVLANKITSVYALGDGKVAYYLGAVENWTAKSQFQPNGAFLNSEQYMFQQWVCNLRGFSRGVRVGSSFALLNSEMRLPVLLLVRKRPMESEFARNFAITCFMDAGTAFIGKSPSDPNNPFNTVYTSSPNYDLAITSRRNPWVIGLGYGVRTRFLGYFIKYDRASGYIEKQWNPGMNYLSLGFDF